MATYRRFRVQRKYINGKPTDETRLGEQIDSTDYTSLEECKRGSGCTNLEYRWVDVQNEYICEGFNITLKDFFDSPLFNNVTDEDEDI